jgi:hypothetical protein
MDPLSVETSDSDESLETEAPAGGGEDSVDEGDFNPPVALVDDLCRRKKALDGVFMCRADLLYKQAVRELLNCGGANANANEPNEGTHASSLF